MSNSSNSSDFSDSCSFNRIDEFVKKQNELYLPKEEDKKRTNKKRKNKKFVKVYVDIENLYFSPDLKLITIRSNRYDYIIECIDNLIKILRRKGMFISNIQLFGDFDKLTNFPTYDFNKFGCEQINVTGSEHKNSADMALNTYMTESVIINKDVSVYVVLTGDRDFISPINLAFKYCKDVYIASFEASISGDLIKRVGSHRVFYMERLLGKDKFDKLQDYKAFQAEQDRKRKENNEDKAKESAPDISQHQQPKSQLAPVMSYAEKVSAGTSKPQQKTYITGQDSVQTPFGNKNQWKRTESTNQYYHTALNLVVAMEKEIKTREVWLTPYLRRLTEKLPNISSGSRKGLITTMEKNGVACISESQIEEGNIFSVIILNGDHPDVIKARESFERCHVLTNETNNDTNYYTSHVLTNETEINSEVSSQNSVSTGNCDTKPFTAVSIRPPKPPLRYEDSKSVFESCFKPGEIWVRGSEIGVRFKKMTDHDFKDSKIRACETIDDDHPAILITRGTGGNHELALRSRVK